MATIVSKAGKIDQLIVYLGDSTIWDGQNGQQLESRWRGTRANLEAKAFELMFAGGVRNWRLSPETDPWWQLSVIYQGDGLYTGQSVTGLSTVWSVESLEFQHDAWLHPRILAEWAKLTGTAEEKMVAQNRVTTVVNAFLKSNRNVLLFYDTDGTLISSEKATLDVVVSDITGYGMSATPFLELMDSLSKQHTSFNVSSVALRKVVTATKGAIFKADLVGINAVYKTATLEAAESIPATIKFSLPTSGSWLKKGPKCEQQSNGTWIITQEWWYADSWDTFLYGEAT